MEFIFSTRSASSRPTGDETRETGFKECCTDDPRHIHAEFDKHKSKVDQNNRRIQQLEQQLVHLKEQLFKLVARVQDWMSSRPKEENEFPDDAATDSSAYVEEQDVRMQATSADSDFRKLFDT